MDDDRLRGHKLNNVLQSLILLLSMVGILALLGWLVAGPDGLLWSVILGSFALALGPTVSPGLVLRMYRARPISAQQAPDLYGVVEEIARRAQLPDPPRLYYVPTRMLNAFAVGSRDQAAIAVTDGLLRTLTLRELAGVLAHEISHIRNKDIWVMGLADVVSRITTALSQVGLILVFIMLPLALVGAVTVSFLGLLVLVAAPMVSNLLQLALSRTREHDADLGAAELTGDPRGLASALEKLERYQGGWIESLFMPGRRIPDPAILRTHPRTDERIRRLLSLELPQRAAPLQWSLPRHSDTLQRLYPPVSRGPRWHISGLWH